MTNQRHLESEKEQERMRLAAGINAIQAEEKRISKANLKDPIRYASILNLMEAVFPKTSSRKEGLAEAGNGNGSLNARLCIRAIAFRTPPYGSSLFDKFYTNSGDIYDAICKERQAWNDFIKNEAVKAACGKLQEYKPIS